MKRVAFLLAPHRMMAVYSTPVSDMPSPDRAKSDSAKSRSGEEANEETTSRQANTTLSQLGRARSPPRGSPPSRRRTAAATPERATLSQPLDGDRSTHLASSVRNRRADASEIVGSCSGSRRRVPDRDGRYPRRQTGRPTSAFERCGSPTLTRPPSRTRRAYGCTEPPSTRGAAPTSTRTSPGPRSVGIDVGVFNAAARSLWWCKNSNGSRNDLT